MRLITAIIKPHKVTGVKVALPVVGVRGMTLSEVCRHGRQGGLVDVYRRAGYQVDLVPKIRLEILVEDIREV